MFSFYIQERIENKTFTNTPSLKYFYVYYLYMLLFNYALTICEQAQENILEFIF